MLWIPSKTIPYCSRQGARRIARVVGFLMVAFPTRARRVAAANLDVVYGTTQTAKEKRRILVKSFYHSAGVLIDYFWFSHRTAERLAEYCEGDDARFMEWMHGNDPGFVVTAHIGNWELGGQCIALKGRTMWSVFRPIGTHRTLDTLLRFRQATGQKVIPRTGAMMGILRAVKHRDLVALLLDQHTDPQEGGIYLDFFGLPAAFSNAVGILAQREGIPICVLGMVHDACRDRYCIQCYGELKSADVKQMEPQAITAWIVAAMERMILANPEQWLWMYRRWKRYPYGEDPKRFPFYAVEDRSILDRTP